MGDFTYRPGSWWQYEGELGGYWLKVSGQGRHIVQMLITAQRDAEGVKQFCVPCDADLQVRAALDPEMLDLYDEEVWPGASDDDFPARLVRSYADRAVKEVTL